LKAKCESGPPYVSLKRLVPGAFNLGLTGSTCTASPGRCTPPSRVYQIFGFARPRYTFLTLVPGDKRRPMTWRAISTGPIAGHVIDTRHAFVTLVSCAEWHRVTWRAISDRPCLELVNTPAALRGVVRPNCRGRVVGPGRHCSQRHMMDVNSSNEGSECVSVTWRELSARPVVRCRLSREARVLTARRRLGGQFAPGLS
jgi:hypothetical protein